MASEQIVKANNPLHKFKALTTSPISLFISNLKLLDLDKRLDWPGITQVTFDTKDALQNQKKRITCSEWALYRLFELWDADTTRDKLQPFFPPLEPLQSVNLRAAFFRCLKDVKGDLGREVVLRNSMLNECKGDKFEEVLLLFSAAVVRKKVTRSRDMRSCSIAQGIGTCTSISGHDLNRILPISLAYKISLRLSLAARANVKTSFDAARIDLDRRTEKLDQRRENMAAAQAPLAINVASEDVEALRGAVAQNWIGISSEHLLLFDGQTEHDELPTLSALTEDPSSAPRRPDQSTERDLFSRLDSVLEAHKVRLNEWRRVFGDGSTRKPSRPVAQAQGIAGHCHFVQPFEQHQSVRIHQEVQPAHSLPALDTKDRYTEIVTTMAQHLSTVTQMSGSTIRLQGQNQQGFIKETNKTTCDEVSPPESLSDQAFSFPHQTLLKHDIFSPVKLADQPLANPQVSLRSWTEPKHHWLRRPSQPTLPRQSRETEDDCGVTAGVHESATLSSPPFPRHNTEDDSMHKIMSQQGLLERTRMSLASFHNEDVESLPQMASPTSGIFPPPDQELQVSAAREEPVSLAERTIKFMSPVSAQQLPPSKREIPRSSGFPVNQFETPIKDTKRGLQATATERSHDPLISNDTTPKEKLFSEEAEYASVFKSRPKIAMSPVVPSIADDIGFGDDSHLALDSSPLGAFQRR